MLSFTPQKDWLPTESLHYYIFFSGFQYNLKAKSIFIEGKVILCYHYRKPGVVHIAKGRSRCNFPLCKKAEIFEHYLAIIIKFSIVSEALHMLLVIVLSIVVFFSEEHVFHSDIALYAFRFSITMV